MDDTRVTTEADGWMRGFPPPPERRIRFSDGSFNEWPQRRWTYNHVEELVPTRAVWRGRGPAIALPVSPLPLDGLRIDRAAGALSWDEALESSYTDSLLVLHRGEAVYETYLAESAPHLRHLIMSCSKSMVGLIAESLIRDGVIDPLAPVPTILPELAASAWGDATVRDVMDMRVGLDYDEDYTDPDSDVWRFIRCTGMIPPLPGQEAIGPADVLPTFNKRGEHGQEFSYQEPNIFVLSWLVRRAAQAPLVELVSDRIWQHIGAEHDCTHMLDPSGGETMPAMTLRDFGRWGQLVLTRGRVGDRQVLPAEIFDDIFQGGDQAAFASAGYDTLPDWSYRSQWWVRHIDGRTCLQARGAYGQFLYIDQVNELVIARFGSAKEAPSYLLDHILLPTIDAITDFVAKERGSS